MKTFDKYLLSRFLYVFGILYVSTFGLFVVFDSFTNVDGFQKGSQGILVILKKISVYYLFQSSLFFDLVASILSVISVMIVFALLYRYSEIHPILAAGISTYRLMVPVVAGTMVVSVVVIVNQEFIIPRISHRLQASHDEGDTQKVKGVYDGVTHIHIGGDRLSLSDGRIKAARFALPKPRITETLTTLSAREATYYRANDGRPAGWHLKDVSPKFEAVRLTAEGREVVMPLKNPNDIFVATDINFETLCNRSRSYVYASTPELIRRIKNPAYDIVSIRSQLIHLHTRLIRPLLSVIMVLVAVPLIIRKESTGLVGNLAVCTGVHSLLFAVAQGFSYMGSVNLIAADLAAWIPVMISGSLGAWLTGVLQT